jgi:hypothetical protein
MATTIALRPAGPTTALSVGAASHSAVTITPTDVNAGFASFLNTGATIIYVRVASTNAGTVTAAAIPGDGASDTEFVLPASMTMPVVYAVPAPAFTVAAIGSAAGPSLVYIQPVSQM